MVCLLLPSPGDSEALLWALVGTGWGEGAGTQGPGSPYHPPMQVEGDECTVCKPWGLRGGDVPKATQLGWNAGRPTEAPRVAGGCDVDPFVMEGEGSYQPGPAWRPCWGWFLGLLPLWVGWPAFTGL